MHATEPRPFCARCCRLAPERLTDEDGRTALSLACCYEHEAAAEELMEVTKLAGALDLQTQGDSKRSALHWAGQRGLAGTVAMLLSLSADAALTDVGECTALWWACYNKHEAAAEELVEATQLAGALDLQDGAIWRQAIDVAPGQCSRAGGHGNEAPIARRGCLAYR
jgi:ankyrin repeat protein|eukprot:Tamp_17617.p1 GENE.Tamp_17617~~Tamp_17617.p1  ORF type:complete len:167 (+),score=32.62 Tamp_17617:568-1068(+)